MYMSVDGGNPIKLNHQSGIFNDSGTLRAEGAMWGIASRLSSLMSASEEMRCWSESLCHPCALLWGTGPEMQRWRALPFTGAELCAQGTCLNINTNLLHGVWVSESLCVPPP